MTIGAEARKLNMTKEPIPPVSRVTLEIVDPVTRELPFDNEPVIDAPIKAAGWSPDIDVDVPPAGPEDAVPTVTSDKPLISADDIQGGNSPMIKLSESDLNVSEGTTANRASKLTAKSKSDAKTEKENGATRSK